MTEVSKRNNLAVPVSRIHKNGGRSKTTALHLPSYTMGEFSRQVGELVHHVTRAASEQGGVISGDNPVNYLAADPFRLWVIQLVIILAMTELLVLIFGRLRQPRVIAEIIGGVFLGPSVFGRIPNFRQKIFPDASLVGLTLTSTVGLILFLFIVGLEIDTKVFKQKRNIAAASAVSVAGLLIPLGLGAVLGVAIYKEFIPPSINYGYFLLFTAVAIGITAFPVLCRILTETKLLDTTVGVVTLAAGIGNDVVGWVLLALTVALVNASNGLTALYVLLASVGYVIFLLYPGRWAYTWLVRRTGCLDKGAPTTGMMTLTLVIVFGSAFFTDIIGVHAIFGGFLAGLIIPHDNGYAISLVEKLEDLVTIVLLPIYFTLSGLRTNLGLMNDGKTWGYTFLICLVAFVSKFVPCFSAAKFYGFNWRECGAIGALMSCKGLVELIVLNIGLQAGILDTRTFSMFVVHAIILTFITTPLTLAFYPAKYRTRVIGAHSATAESGLPQLGRTSSSRDEAKTRFALVLDRVEQLPAAMTISQLLQNKSINTELSPTTSTATEREKAPESPRLQPTSINALRLIELTGRTSAVLKSTSAEQLISSDAVVSVFRTFGYLNRLLVSAALSVVPQDEYPSAINTHVQETDSQMVILPWARNPATEGEQPSNPFDGLFRKSTGTPQDQTIAVHSEFVRRVFASSSSAHVALFVDRGLGHPFSGDITQHLFLPFFGGPDDRLALSFVVQLCQNPSIRATVIRIQTLEDLTPTTSFEEKDPNVAPGIPLAVALPLTIAAADTLYGHRNTATRLASETADNIAWSRYTSNTENHDSETAAALSRIQFDNISSAKPLHTIIDLVTQKTSDSVSVITVLGRSRRLAVETHTSELQLIVKESGTPMGTSVTKTLGEVGAALVASNTAASLLVLQAAPTSSV